MAGRYRKYPEFKDSKIEWVGEIPSWWDVKPLFSTVITDTEKNVNGYETNVLSLSYGNIVKRDVEANFGLLPESFNTYQLIGPGDLVLRLTDLQNDKRSLRVGFAKERGIITSAYLKLIAKSGEFDSRFLYRLLHSYDTTKVFYGMGGGLRQSMKFEDMRRLPVLVPPLDEQSKIATFLDHETAKIDTLIDKQQQLIALLKEKRQAVISHAVTKGLNPDAPMKDSGVEWLGAVPAFWNITEIRHVTRQIGGGTPSKDRWDFWNGNIPWVSPKDMKVDYIDSAQDMITVEAVNSSSTKIVPIGSVLVVVRGMILVHSVPVSFTTRPITINQDMKALVPSEMVSGEYLLFLLKGLRDIILELVDNSAHGTKCLRTELFERMIIALPSRDEQDQIIAYLKEKLSCFDCLLTKAGMAIQLLNERRTALISAAVTGKIDVRNWQPPPSSSTTSRG